MLYGEYEHALDAKGRVTFPAKLREELGDRFYITKGLNDCLFVYSEPEWAELEQKLRALPMSKSRKLQMFFFAGAAEAEADKQGRVLVPANLREFAGLDKNVMIVGTSARAEIWDRERYRKFNEDITSDQIEEAMDTLGF